MATWIASLFLLLTFFSGAAFAGETAALAKGKNAAGALTRALRERLEAAATGADPAGAFSACSYQAAALTGEIEMRSGVRLKRTSLRLRNPRNAPDDFEKAVLERFETLMRAGSPREEALEEVLFEGKKAFRYVEPIYMASYCIACHGIPAEMSAEIRAILRERYPRDQATDYRTGDLRGIVSVVIPAE